MNTEPRYPIEAWQTLFPGVAYPAELPDDMVRALANIGVCLREAGDMLTKAIASQDTLTLLMPLGLLTGGVKQLRDLALKEFDR